MAITPVSMNKRIYQMSQKTPGVPVVNGNHIKFDAVNRMDCSVVKVKNRVYDVSFTLNGAGKTFYLPYQWDKICSCVLPHTPPLNGIRTVFTANLSGCAIFIDREAVTNNIIFSHANTVHDSPTRVQSETQPTYQTNAANATLTGLHGLITAQYPGSIPLAQLRKPIYNDPVQAEINRKTGQEREGITFFAGTTVIGFYLAGGWRFYYQTWGFLDYTRPDNLKVKFGFHKRERKGVMRQDERVYGGRAHQFYP